MMNPAPLQQIIAAAQAAQRSGRTAEATRLWRDVLAKGGEQPIALNMLGLQALNARDPAGAAALFARAVAADPRAPDLHMNLARAERERGDDAAERAALDGALAIDQRHFMALVRMAELFERQGDRASAAERWSGVLALSVGIDVARAEVPAADRRRFDACIDAMLGRRQVYANVCHGLHFPFLPADEFFDSRHFPWFAEIEAKTDVIRAELEALVAAAAPGFKPYVAMAPGVPENKWSALDHKLDWSAYHLWKDGVRDDAACALCPETAAAVEALPLSDLPGRTPTVFFSLLRPGTHLPAHTGVSNTRAIVHLPLIVPEGCSFRVGGETRDWQVGKAWAFDDTIEHEAWNRSSEMRAVLIFDVWNPHIREEERDLLRRFFPVADAHGYDLRTQVGD